MLIPLILAVAVKEELVSARPGQRDQGLFLQSAAGQDSSPGTGRGSP